MVQNPEVAGHNLVLDHGALRNVDPIPVVGDDDHRALQHHVLAEGHVPRHGQMVQLYDLGDVAEPLQELLDFSEVAGPQLDEGGGGEGPERVHDEGAGRKVVEVGHD